MPFVAGDHESHLLQPALNAVGLDGPLALDADDGVTGLDDGGHLVAGLQTKVVGGVEGDQEVRMRSSATRMRKVVVTAPWSTASMVPWSWLRALSFIGVSWFGRLGSGGVVRKGWVSAGRRGAPSR